jgi:hypothetical protein
MGSLAESGSGARSLLLDAAGVRIMRGLPEPEIHCGEEDILTAVAAFHSGFGVVTSIKGLDLVITIRT